MARSNSTIPFFCISWPTNGEMLFYDVSIPAWVNRSLTLSDINLDNIKPEQLRWDPAKTFAPGDLVTISDDGSSFVSKPLTAISNAGRIVFVDNLLERDAITPEIGDQVYVRDTEDVNGNNRGEWSMWTWGTGGPANNPGPTMWIRTANQDSETTDAKTLSWPLTGADNGGQIVSGPMSAGSKLVQIIIMVREAFDGTLARITVGDGNDILMDSAFHVDMTTVGTYAVTTDKTYPIGGNDVYILTELDGFVSTGAATVIVTYV